ncbi:MAG: type secretion system rane protein PorP/SprF [Flavipsychrobacter sp.]|jgi:type IX secretion system PorP/SprF family membrane protein|nr:type secretion system rane protein PorP/SprF [Flavipsychrobacter sp.]
MAQISKVWLFTALIVNTSASAQDVHYVQFDATPLAVNPALTGMFDGSMRMSALYRNQWANEIIPYVTSGTSFDMPVFTDKKKNYVGMGTQIIRNTTGDGTLYSFSMIFSAAYHKHFGKKDGNICDFGIGLQGAYLQRNYDVAYLFYGGEFLYGQFANTWGSGISFMELNVGLSFSQSLGQHFNYTIGLSENNIREPSEKWQQQQAIGTGIVRNTTGVFSAIWRPGKLSFRPCIHVVVSKLRTAIIGGNEFHYTVSKNKQHNNPVSVFAGGWYRLDDIASVTVGAEFLRVRIGMAVDCTPVPRHMKYSGLGAVEFSVKYTTPANLWSAKKRDIPHNRF